MTTRLSSVHAHTPLALTLLETGSVDIQVGSDGAVYDRAEFLVAVEAELGVLIIDKTTLPETHVGDGKVDFVYGEQGHVEPIPQGMDADELIALGLALKANPPLDEDQVNTIATILDRIEDEHGHNTPNLARLLVRAGVRAPEETGR